MKFSHYVPVIFFAFLSAKKWLENCEETGDCPCAKFPAERPCRECISCAAVSGGRGDSLPPGRMEKDKKKNIEERYGEGKKQRLRQSRRCKMKMLAEAVKRCIHRSTNLWSISAVWDTRYQ